VSVPKTLKAERSATWTAKAEKGSVFANWEGDFVESLGLSRNELRNPSLKFVVPADFDTNGVRAVFVSYDSDGLGSLLLSSSEQLTPDEEVSELELVDDSKSYVTASVSGLPTGVKFNAKTLAFSGRPTKPGVYFVKVTAKNASGYQWAETLEMRVSDREDKRIDFSGLPESGAKGESYFGKIAADGFKTLSASGLPAGLKFDSMTGDVTGVPTKGGHFTVTATATYADRTKAVATRLVTVSPVVAPDPKPTAYYPLTAISSDEDAGTTSGTGVYADGKKASVSAKPAKGRVFAGWYRDAGLSEPMVFASGDYRKSSQSVVVPEVRYLYARFVDATEKADPVADLEATGPGFSAENGFEWRVGVAVPDGDGVSFASASLPAASAAKLPPGVKFDAAKCRFTGVPTKAGPYTATVTVKNASKSTSTLPIPIDVKPLDSWAQGTFNGATEEDGAPVGLVQSFAVSATGKISGKLQEDALAWTLSAASYSSYDTERAAYAASVVAKSGTRAFTNEIEVSEEAVDGSPRGVVSGGGLVAWQNLWKTEQWKNVAKPFANKVLLLSGPEGGLPKDGDTMALKFAASGAVTASGKFASVDEKTNKDIVYSASCSTVLIPAGNDRYAVFLYFPPKGGKFPGYAARIGLEWTGSAFNRVEASQL
jgi:hypothetical protein